MDGCICYEEHRFQGASLTVITEAVEIAEEYAAQGYGLTLRQLYYQFVARGLLPNTVRSYKNLGRLISNARLAGIMPWTAIEDRMRKPDSVQHWEGPDEILAETAEAYHRDTRATQPQRVELWVEKDALVDVVERVGRTMDLTWFACRGYVSQSAMWRAAQRFIEDAAENSRPGIILYMGDHDPSGIDMGRDIQQRMDLFQSDVTVLRIALNRDQVDRHALPPNPAKLTDSRASEYVREHGQDSWELDALPPDVLTGIIGHTVYELTDDAEWHKLRDFEELERADLRRIVEDVRQGS